MKFTWDVKNTSYWQKRGSTACPLFYPALREAGFSGVFVGVLAIMEEANTIELRKREYQLINHYKTSLNVLKKDITYGNIITGKGIPIIILNIFNWKETLFYSIAAAARWINKAPQTVASAIKLHNIVGCMYLVMKADSILTPKEIIQAISSKQAKPVIVTILETGERLEFSSYTEAAAFIGCSQPTVANALKQDPAIISKNNKNYQIFSPPQ